MRHFRKIHSELQFEKMTIKVLKSACVVRMNDDNNITEIQQQPSPLVEPSVITNNPFSTPRSINDGQQLVLVLPFNNTGTYNISLNLSPSPTYNNSSMPFQTFMTPSPIPSHSFIQHESSPYQMPPSSFPIPSIPEPMASPLSLPQYMPSSSSSSLPSYSISDSHTNPPLEFSPPSPSHYLSSTLHDPLSPSESTTMYSSDDEESEYDNLSLIHI